MKAIEIKLDRLLEAYLDKLIDSQTYQDKKNSLIQAKADLQENLKEINTAGNTWLEPFCEWADQVFHAWKTMRAKNNGHELAFMAKTVGSNFLLKDRRLSTSFKKGGFDALSVEAGAESATSRPPSNSYWLPDLDSNQEKRLQRPL